MNNTHYLFIHSIDENEIFSTIWLSWISLLWISVYESLRESVFSFLLNKYPGVELPVQMVTVCLALQETAKLFSQEVASLYVPSGTIWEFQLLLTLRTFGTATF